MNRMSQQPKTAALNTFLVGGAVRDELLGLKVNDRDYLVVGATPAQMLALGFTPVGKDFPVFLHPKTKEEYALARTERKQGHGYHGFVCYAQPDVTIEQDLQRRDLTINAMARASDGTLVDPFHGQDDVHNKLLRHVSGAFSEDPLRVLRVARFAARFYPQGFTVAPETLALMQQIAASGELSTLTPERIWQELQLSLTTEHPERFFDVLRASHALQVIWPELDALWGIPNPPRWHPEICTGVHTMMVLQQAVLLSTNISVRFAALCHDLGKGLTPAPQLPHHQGHETAGLALVENVCDRFKVPNKTRWLALKVCRYHLHCHQAFELRAKTILAMFDNLDLWRNPAELGDFLLACEADFRGRLGLETQPYPQKNYLIACAKAAKSINAKAFVDQGLQGLAIKNAMHKARLEAINIIKLTADILAK